MNRKWLLALPAVFLALAGGAPAQETRTVWSAVYSPAQAAVGRAHYDDSCSRCHAADLSGGVGGSLKGDIFIRDWGGRTLTDLFERIRKTMPRGAPGSLSDDAYLRIVTYILEANGFPSNPTTDLRLDALQAIRIEGKDGPDVIPNLALVESVGCLTQGPDKVWLLTDATDLVRSREAGAPNEEALKAAASLPLGKGSLRLLYILPAPDALKGHKVHSKGALMRDPKGDSINVSWLRSVAAECK
jgi:mono/diheme cytochrome c family protein